MFDSPFSKLEDNCEFWLDDCKGDELKVEVDRHVKVGRHTYYHLQCTYRLGHSTLLQWSVWTTLHELRKGLHDPVKQALGKSSYELYFRRSPFAHHLGLKGTTARLSSWFKTL